MRGCLDLLQIVDINLVRLSLVRILGVQPGQRVEAVGHEPDQVVTDRNHSLFVSSRGLFEARAKNVVKSVCQFNEGIVAKGHCCATRECLVSSKLIVDFLNNKLGVERFKDADRCFG